MSISLPDRPCCYRLPIKFVPVQPLKYDQRSYNHGDESNIVGNLFGRSSKKADRSNQRFGE